MAGKCVLQSMAIHRETWNQTKVGLQLILS